MTDNPFEDLEALRVNGEDTQPAPTPKRQQRRQREDGYLLVPAGWLLALRAARPPVSGATYAVAFCLLERFYREGSRTVRLSNLRMETWGSLRQLVGLGLISTEQTGTQSTAVTALVDPFK